MGSGKYREKLAKHENSREAGLCGGCKSSNAVVRKSRHSAARVNRAAKL
jgi:hypothetical protein